MHVGLGPGDQALLAQLGHHGVERLGRLHPAEALRRGVRDAAVLADHHDLVEAVPAADVEVALVVARGDLERARAELGIHVVVGDDRQPTAHERQDRRLTYQPRVALVAGFTAMAVSASIVSGRTVATVTDPDPDSSG